ncbi:MAG TPA: protein kinase [Polyangiaceae bacterium LLY-WYZ-15_(1-7)]|nr:protein kinase [Polyangiaceae bacterium LLY-WYZ-15_(1-7)]HJL12302.1 protein kinase [Polyangiaceae bacterium LLY-WYZ-15_(1-7)]HJL23171.1 protein kinase [Polyangiaceae bacterium LLY-WYZ-15_(1-7)]HJL39471.1 protein kinase [Polyangiaceae bacterium LLY-WYZ-15_(1-7)]
MATGRMTLEQLMAALDMEAVPEDHALDSTLLPTLAPRVRRERKSSRPPEDQVDEHAADPAAEDQAGAKGAARSLSDRSLSDRPLSDRPPEELRSQGLRVKGPLAEGGMGRIDLAEQGGLRRDVALKTLRDEFLEPAFADRLLREARVLAQVEHPHVVPLYGLEADARNAPVLVMKRIEGVPWRRLIRDDAHPAFPADAEDRLAWHLHVLMDVCDAVHYAHSKGVLHLDLKPDNVMIGAFREVLLVDWGVAVCTDEAKRGWLPMADEVQEVLGTPAYLAPEMVDVARRALGPATDVYLLGATLYEILTGEPPHHGGSLQEMLYAAYEAEEPELPPEVPRELAAICRRAMAPEPDDRYASAEELRRALRGFLAHRSAAALVRKSRSALADLRQRVRAAVEEPTAPGQRIHARSDAENAAVQRAFARCRFGFVEARRQWPENEDAREGAREALRLMAEYHLHRGEAASAETLLLDLPEDDRRGRQLRAEAERQRREAARFERIGHEVTRDPGHVSRGRLLLGGALFVSLPILVAWGLNKGGIYGYRWWHTLLYDLLLAAFFGAGGIVGRGRLAANRRGQQLVLSLVFMALLATLLRMLSLAMGLWTLRSTAIELFFFGSGCVLAGLLADRRFYLAVPGLFLGAVLVLLLPADAQLWIGLAALAGPVPLAVAWMRRRNEAETNDSTSSPKGGAVS